MTAFILQTLFWIYVTFLGFMVYASAKAAWRRLKIGIKVLLIPALLIFGALDVVLLNAVVGTLLFMEPPKELTFSQRCSRHFYTDGWRGRMARAFAVPLNAIDIGHIG